MRKRSETFVGMQEKEPTAPQVKICGITRVEDALACAESGARAVGLVFYPRSPRYVTDDRARAIGRALPASVMTVGVFVDASFDEIMRKEEACGIEGVQLHGHEPPGLVERLRGESLLVIKALFVLREPSLQTISDYSADAYLVECGQGPLPGGNARAWNWESAEPLTDAYPIILAGGLHPDNVSEAVQAACPDAVDVSSGVELEPGIKDIDKIQRFLRAVSSSSGKDTIRRIFR